MKPCNINPISNTSVLLVGDIHLKGDNLGVAEKLFDELYARGKSGRHSSIVFMGDIFDVKGVIRVEVQNFFYSKINKLLNLNIHVHVLVGNHDMVGMRGDQHAFGFLRSLEVSEFLHIHETCNEFKDDSGIRMILMPWYRDSIEFFQSLQSCMQRVPDDGMPTFLFCHQEFKGFHLNGRTHIVGDDGVDQSMVRNSIQRIFSGHIHLLQDHHRVQYVGVPYTHNFGESNEWNGIVNLSHDMNTWATEFIRLQNIPHHISYDVPVRDGKIDWSMVDFEHNEFDFVRIVVSGDKEDCLKFGTQLLIKQSLKDINVPVPHALVVKYKFNEVAIARSSDFGEATTYGTLMNNWVELGQYNAELKAHLKRLGQAVIETCGIPECQ